MEKNDDINKLLNYIYYELKNFDGVENLYKKAKPYNKSLTKEDVKNWLKKQSVVQQTTIPEVVKEEFKPIYNESHYSYQIDLTFLYKFKKQNDNFDTLFTAININSRYAYAYYSKGKETKEIIKMLNLFLKNAHIIESVTMDGGSEFTNHEVKKWFKENNIKTFIIINDSNKLGIINRFHRTLKDKLSKYFISNDTTRWIDIIDKIIDNYNNTKIRTIGFSPKEASKGIIQSLIINKAKSKTEFINKLENNNFQIGQTCRIKEKKKLFDKMKTLYSNDIYTIIKVNKNTVKVESNNKDIKTVKNNDILIINEVQNDKPIINNANIDKEYKISRNLKQLDKKEDIKPENIIKEKRIINKPKRYLD